MKVLKPAKKSISLSQPRRLPNGKKCAARFGFPLVIASRCFYRKDGFVGAYPQCLRKWYCFLSWTGVGDRGWTFDFSLRMPGDVLGTPHDVLVHCLGRVVRCSLSQSQYLAAATIDEYQFAEQ